MTKLSITDSAQKIEKKLTRLRDSCWIKKGNSMSFPVHESITPHVTPHVTPQVEKLILIIGGEMTRQELQDSLNLSDRMNFLKTYLQPAIESGVLEMTIPDKPKNRDQRYRLTNAGKEFKKRLQVPSDYNFRDLHVAIQDAMGWQDYQLHHFEIKGKGKRKEVRIGIPDFDGFVDLPEVFPGWEKAVIAYFNSLGVEAVYEYDYGDGWIHVVKLEGYMFREKGIKYPICIDGKNACPPEDY